MISTWQHRSVKYLGIFLTFWVVSGDVLNYLVKEANFQPQNEQRISMLLASKHTVTSQEVHMLSPGCTVCTCFQFLTMWSNVGLYECVVAAHVKSGEGILEVTGDVAACSAAHCCLPAGICCPHLFAQMLCRQIQACRYSLFSLGSCAK